jgi:hypothetical protein
MGWALLAMFEFSPAYVLALSGGFLLVGPFLCLGMYRVSQKLENGEKPSFLDSVLAWRARTGQLGIFGVVLLVLEMLWARSTLVVFAVTFDGVPDFKGSLRRWPRPRTSSSPSSGSAWACSLRSLIYCRQRGVDADDPAPPHRRHHRRPDQHAAGVDADGRDDVSGPR